MGLENKPKLAPDGTGSGPTTPPDITTSVSPHGINIIRINPNLPLFVGLGRISDEIEAAFNGRRSGGGATKNAMIAGDQIYLLTQSVDEEHGQHLGKVITQVEFYEKYRQEMEGIVVPIESILMHGDRVVGMSQKLWGRPIYDALEAAQQPTAQQIDEFIKRYTHFIEITHAAHGDFAGDTLAMNLDNIRYDPSDTTCPFRFIDYYGNMGKITTGFLEQVGPDDERYNQVLAEDPERFRKRLYQLFRIPI